MRSRKNNPPHEQRRLQQMADHVSVHDRRRPLKLKGRSFEKSSIMYVQQIQKKDSGVTDKQLEEAIISCGQMKGVHER